MKTNNAQVRIFRKVLGIGLIALAVLGATSLSMKEIPLALFGVRTTGIVKKVEVITTSTHTKWEKTGSGSKRAVSRGGDLTFMYIEFSTNDGQPAETKTLATFNTVAKVGDQHPLIYLTSNPGRAKIYSAKQLWLPMCVGLVFSSVCLFLGLKLFRIRPVPTV